MTYQHRYLDADNFPYRTQPSATINGNKIYLVLGLDVNLTSVRETWKFDINLVQWSALTTTNSPSLSGHVSHFHLNIIYTIGGYIKDENPLYSQNLVYSLNLSTGEWNAVNTNGPQPISRFFHASCINYEDGIIYIHGGRRFGFEILGDIWSYEISSATWTQLVASDNPMDTHSCVYDKIRKYIYCTYTPYQSSFQIWLFDFKFGWTLLSQPQSNERYFFRGQTCFYNTQRNIFYIVGGYFPANSSIYPNFLALSIDTMNNKVDILDQVYGGDFPSVSDPSTVYDESRGISYHIGGYRKLGPPEPIVNSMFSITVVSDSPPKPYTTGKSYTAIIVTCILVPCICFILIGLCWYRRLQHYKQQQQQQNDSSIDSDAPMTPTYNQAFNDILGIIPTPRLSLTLLHKEKTNVSNSTGGSRAATYCLLPGAKVINYISIDWQSIRINSVASNIVLGQGSFGIVIRAVWETVENKKRVSKDVAVKIITKLSLSNEEDLTRSKEYQAAMEEIDVIQTARSRMTCTDNVICVYGVAIGVLPTDLCDNLNLSLNKSSIGIVMRYEGGGPLSNLYKSTQVGSPKDPSTSRPTLSVPLVEKIRILRAIARGLAELHSVGVIHGDIKPDNILLSSDDPPQVRLADFGISSVREVADFVDTTLEVTKHQRGTLLYNAPEMLVNPFLGEIHDYKVASPSRRTDVYAFAILACEFLTEMKPYGEKKLKEVTLSMAVHQGIRPSLGHLPTDCPQSVIDMIKVCWGADRQKRLTAAACYRILNQEYLWMTDDYSDVLLSHHPDDRQLVERLYSLLDLMGLKVTLSDGDNQPDSSTEAMSESSERFQRMLKCKVIVACISKTYQDSEECLAHLRHARNATPVIQIVPLILEPDHESWLNTATKYYCQLKQSDSETVYFTYHKRKASIAQHAITVLLSPSDHSIDDHKDDYYISNNNSVHVDDIYDVEDDSDGKQTRSLKPLCKRMYQYIQQLINTSIATPRNPSFVL